MKKVKSMLIPEIPEEYEVWQDDKKNYHFRVINTHEDWLLEGTVFSRHKDDREGWYIKCFDVLHKKHCVGWCPLDHPLVRALKLEGK